MKRVIEISVDTFAQIWSERLGGENDEDQILSRILADFSARAAGQRPAQTAPEGRKTQARLRAPALNADASMPVSKKWTDLLVWTLDALGGAARLEDIYRKSREGRTALGIPITPQHNASARECLESHCAGSDKFRGKADLFFRPEGKGAGIWALRPAARG
jgi:hypothetical protein